MDRGQFRTPPSCISEVGWGNPVSYSCRLFTLWRFVRQELDYRSLTLPIQFKKYFFEVEVNSDFLFVRRLEHPHYLQRVGRDRS